jgi:hypothetical protein
MLSVRNRHSHPMSISSLLMEIKENGVVINRQTASLVLQAVARLRCLPSLIP